MQAWCNRVFLFHENIWKINKRSWCWKFIFQKISFRHPIPKSTNCFAVYINVITNKPLLKSDQKWSRDGDRCWSIFFKACKMDFANLLRNIKCIDLGIYKYSNFKLHKVWNLYVSFFWASVCGADGVMEQITKYSVFLYSLFLLSVLTYIWIYMHRVICKSIRTFKLL